MSKTLNLMQTFSKFSEIIDLQTELIEELIEALLQHESAEAFSNLDISGKMERIDDLKLEAGYAP